MLPSAVGYSLASVTHTAFGDGAVKRVRDPAVVVNEGEKVVMDPRVSLCGSAHASWRAPAVLAVRGFVGVAKTCRPWSQSGALTRESPTLARP